MDALAILCVAEAIERRGLPKHAAKLRLAVVAGDDPDRTAPVQEPRGGEVLRIPWGLHMLMYSDYGSGQTAEDLARRSGFSRGELGRLSVGMYRRGRDGVDQGFERSYPLLELYRVAAGAGLMP